MSVRPLSELSDVNPSAWQPVMGAVDASPLSVRVLPVDPASGNATLYALQVTVGSTLGALARNCGGVLIDHGWVRLLGGGSELLPSLATANRLADPATQDGPPPFLVVGYDVLGGQFAIDGGGLGVAPGEVCHWSPDSLGWEGLGLGHGDFVHAFLSGATTQFYESMRWDGWERDVAAVTWDQGLSLMPPPFNSEGADLSRVSRRAVPFDELLAFYADIADQAAQLPSGQTFRFTVTD